MKSIALIEEVKEHKMSWPSNDPLISTGSWDFTRCLSFLRGLDEFSDSLAGTEIQGGELSSSKPFSVRKKTAKWKHLPRKSSMWVKNFGARTCQKTQTCSSNLLFGHDPMTIMACVDSGQCSTDTIHCWDEGTEYWNGQSALNSD